MDKQVASELSTQGRGLSCPDRHVLYKQGGRGIAEDNPETLEGEGGLPRRQGDYLALQARRQGDNPETIEGAAGGEGEEAT